ncbi:hypothetical protein BGX27_007823 [Mortierella sp. AM989]|nr:hypothetical protein BGX27_007823 [Mortierella sp. AM989]
MSFFKSLRSKSMQSLHRSDSYPKIDPFKSQDQILPKNASHCQQGIPITPLLFMTEILDPIFTHLDHKSLISARSVCHMWSIIGRRYLSFKTQWRSDLSDAEKAKVIVNLPEFDTLEYSNWYDTWVEIDEALRSNITNAPEPTATWSIRLLNAIQVLSSYNNIPESHKARQRALGLDIPKIRLRKLVIRVGRQFDEGFYDLIHAIPTLTSLELVGSIGVKTELFSLLRSGPNLRQLVVENDLFEDILWQPRNLPWGSESASKPTMDPTASDAADAQCDIRSSENSGSCGPVVFNLATLAIRWPRMGQTSLHALLRALPNLLALEICPLIPMRNAEGIQEIFDRQYFYRTLVQSCPRLDSLQFSLYNETLNTIESVVMQQCFPKLKELSMVGRDLNDRGMGYQIDVLEHYVNYLTRLEISCNSVVQRNKFLDQLHNFLCNSRHLKHLVAPGVQYWTEYLDLVEIQGGRDRYGYINDNGDNGCSPDVGGGRDEQVYFQPRNTTVRQSPDWRVASGGWACRSLETLHLGFRERFGSSTHSEYSRIVFGYISGYCPQMKDLFITKHTLNLYVEGGLCLLTRLKDLEKLKIASNAKNFLLDAADVNWIGCHKPHSGKLATPMASEEGVKTIATTITSAATSMMLTTIKNDIKRHVSGSFSSMVPQSLRRRKTRSRRMSTAMSLDEVGRVFLLEKERNSISKKFMDEKSVQQGSACEDLPFTNISESIYPCWPNLRAFILAVDPDNLFKNKEDENLIPSLRPDINFCIQQE